ncbi:N-acetylmuramoyl-L-alanine amidase [Zoogloea sp. LCSB751]|uniref:N-acetylmuramoyl-L-alanine amidase n=1 Tax=Zoogloea sp. LCSB751 TaxID=1965277 RepID=UPI000B496A07|nr:N-acetylmuramoyl-L-alanine amidase [Zoogloea sp. LCSB751]
MRRRLALLLLTVSVGAAQAVPVAVDVGHYLERPGATSAYGVAEFEYNQSLAAVLAARLVADGVPVRLIGWRGEMADLRERPRQAEAAGAGFFLSIHHDSVQESQLEPWVWSGRALRHADGFAGYSLYVSRLNPHFDESLACARAIGAALSEAGLPIATHHAASAPGLGLEWADVQRGVYYYDTLVVLKAATVPAVLLEAGVIVNRDEERQLAGAERRTLTAAAVARGLRDCGVTGR